jgi:hypothetical protein
MDVHGASVFSLRDPAVTGRATHGTTCGLI